MSLGLKPSIIDQDWERAMSLIPNGTMTLSKCPDRYVNGVYPKFLLSAKGCKVRDTNGTEYIDFICGLGPIILGYSDVDVTAAVTKTIDQGQVILSLPHPKEMELAQALKNHIPFAEQSNFFKTGSDALTAAVKVARAYTGKEKVLVCGYHGWHDWYTIANDKKAGIPKALGPLVGKFKYNDPEGLLALLDSGNIAAVVMEPVIYDAPKPGYLEAVKRMTREHGALLIFDEVVTGIRFGLYGAAGYFNVEPDLACYSKALGNGYPIAALSGRKEFMSVFKRDDFFVSGTFGGDLIGISAALAVIGVFENNPTFIDDIWRDGNALKVGFNRLTEVENLKGVSAYGYAPRTMFMFPTDAHKALFWQECLKRGVMFGYANFISVAHKLYDIDKTLDVCEGAFKVVKRHWADPKSRLEGAMPKEVFRLIR